ncbi:hypothetical protein FRC09_020419 [Ceratobasidium sp. 395]|nr:hypothetical protein FRC09_020419 [Ceratobasidium sp. 395]
MTLKHQYESETKEERPRHIPRRMDIDRRLNHEQLLVELEESSDMEPSRRRPRLSTSVTLTRWEAARTMLCVGVWVWWESKYFAKLFRVDRETARATLDAGQKRRKERAVGRWWAMNRRGRWMWSLGVFQIRDPSRLRNVSVALDHNSEHEEEQELEGPTELEVARKRHQWAIEETSNSDRTFDGHKTLDGGIPFEADQTPWDEDEEGRQGCSTDSIRRSWLGLALISGRSKFPPTDWDISSLGLNMHPLDLGFPSVGLSRRTLELVLGRSDLGLKRRPGSSTANGMIRWNVEDAYGEDLDIGRAGVQTVLDTQLIIIRVLWISKPRLESHPRK